MTEILDRIGLPAMLEQLAEECGELTQAALKLARLRRGENPTPKTEEECLAALTEEIADVELCIRELMMEGLVDSNKVMDIIDQKANRWLDRLKEQFDRKAGRQQAEEGEQE